jgi:hypothetical protein
MLSTTTIVLVIIGSVIGLIALVFACNKYLKSYLKSYFDNSCHYFISNKHSPIHPTDSCNLHIPKLKWDPPNTIEYGRKYDFIVFTNLN